MTSFDENLYLIANPGPYVAELNKAGREAQGIEHIDDYVSVLLKAAKTANQVIISVPNIKVVPLLHDSLVVPWHMLASDHVNVFTPAILDAVLRRLFPQARTRIDTYGPFFPPLGALHYHVRAVVEMETTPDVEDKGGIIGVGVHKRR